MNCYKNLCLCTFANHADFYMCSEHWACTRRTAQYKGSMYAVHPNKSHFGSHAGCGPLSTLMNKLLTRSDVPWSVIFCLIDRLDLRITVLHDTMTYLATCDESI